MISKEERHDFILVKIKKERKLVMTDLAAELGVSEHTVRRDLKELSDAGLLRAIRGGATLRSNLPFDIYDRNNLDVMEKQAIAEKSITLLKDHQVVFFDGGTTTQAIASNIPDSLNLTVVTHSLPIANILANLQNISLIFAGGAFCKSSLTMQGQQTISTFEEIYADVSFIGVCSLDPYRGLTARTREETAIKRVLCKNSMNIVAATTSNKLDTLASFLTCRASDISYLITEKDPSDDILQPYAAQGITIL
ncbi:DeoR/GlpR family DNA-binding transcription regulator [Sphingobacterium sp. 40-24]|uniref:DeoR/GlpR family DNA-binding transcription regulator n=1 Tax=Sphingobacterium sp. 40-24 TaxID=1895843 RepID=UPI000A42CDCC|nr:DeoR/GlpR family DNA-binding transcription regulator [Sphingobacterium sp. 40-24]